ncbi:hypothetical protein DL96DRAFT_1590468 [Flagelloscypha sp. PMI_526]|nr:hypothetical protein DL96DRAFT_1590468 [Flagelloscypha sp. PMI_526]
MPSNGTAHYTSLTLPRAPMPSSLSRSPSNKVKVRWTSSGKIDLTTSGVAQTTMATVEVVAGLSSSSSTKRRSWKLFPSSKRKSTTLSMMSSQDASPLAFTSHRPPPSSVPPSHVLVQVWAVGVDCIDGRLAGIRLDRANPMEDGQNDEEENFPVPPAVGFVPGRSFVGRILDCGFDPSDYEETGLKKGEWIVGLCDIRKSGALAEFITIDRHRVHRINQPIMPSLSGPILHSSGRLETLALLALIGVPAYRAIRSLILAFGTDDGTLPSLTPHLPTDNLASGLTRRLSMKPRGPSLPTLQLPPPTPPQQRKALILRGNTPIGLALIQMLVKRKWTCVAHASLPPYLKGEKEVREWMSRVEQIVRDAGGVEVVFDDGDPEGDTPRSSLDEEYGMYGIKSNARTKARGERQPALRVIDRFREDGDVFDLVIDTIGGKDIWRACEALLATPITVAPLLTPGGGLSESSARSAVLHHVHGRGKSEIGISGGDDHSTTKDGKESIYSSLTSKTGTMTLGRTFSRRYRKNKSSSSTMSKHEQQFGIAQFITLVGDHPLHPIGTAKQHLKAGMRALNPASSSTTSMVSGRRKVTMHHEGEDVNRSLEGFLKEGVGIWGLFDGDGQKGEESGRRVVSFDQAPQLLFREASEVLKDGGVGVIRVVP